MSEVYVKVAVRSPLRRLFTYATDLPVQRGQRVSIPFGRRTTTGVVWDVTTTCDEDVKLKAIEAILDEEPLFDERTLQFYEKACQYYGISLGDLLHSSIPQKFRTRKASRELAKKHFVPLLAGLSESQKDVLKKISAGGLVHLLWGETGSGKTEIYLHLFQKILEENGQALLLVPEISLTPQLRRRLEERLGAPVSLFHSDLKESEREAAFLRAARGEADIFLGARSALFLPYRNLKLIIVDEEHDASFKQNERGPYHARDLALLRSKLFQIPIVLGSATPSLESLERPHQETHRLSSYFQRPQPQIEILDLKATWKLERKSFLTQKLHSSLIETLERKEQALVFMNRRGSASDRICTSCGHSETCRQCSVRLTIHKDLNAGICHWCGFQKPLAPKCSQCEGKDFFLGGIGTKEIEASLKEQFPEARIGRLDRDQAQKRHALDDTLQAFSRGDLDILVGTQMISKGIDIPNLTLVALVLADQGLSLPDFRSSERFFQLLKQLLGRAGRRGQQARLLIQTLSPDLELFQLLSKGERAFDAFAEAELKVRRAASLPPFAKLALITLSHRSEKQVFADGHKLAKRVQKLSERLGILTIGPVPAPLSRWKGEYRVQLLIKASPKAMMTAYLTAIMDDLENDFKLTSKIKLDRDPYQFV